MDLMSILEDRRNKMSADIYKMLVDYSNREVYPWHMPGHKRKLANVLENPYKLDVTEVEGTDDLHNPQELIKASLNKLASIYESKESFYLVNGSTVGILSAISTVCRRGDRIVVARNCHKSVYHAVELLDLAASYLYPVFMEEFQTYGQVDMEELHRIIGEEEGIKAVVLVSPTYEGIVSDIEQISDILHKKGIMLIVDEAHGAHFEFGEEFPRPAIRLGADFVIESLHKTLPALTQTAILHFNGPDQYLPKLKRYLTMYQTSSPSYVLLASMDYGIDYAQNNRNTRFVTYSQVLDKYRELFKKLTYIRLMDKENLGNNIFDYDKGKLVFSVKKAYECIGYTGKQFLQDMTNEHGQVLEMATETYAIGMTSIMDEEQDFQRLYEGVLGIDEKLKNLCRKKQCISSPAYFSHIKRESLELAMTSYEAMGQEAIEVPIEEASGCISRNYVYIYPPGIPFLVPGEVINKEWVEVIKTYVKEGLEVRGIKKTSQGIFMEVLQGKDHTFC